MKTIRTNIIPILLLFFVNASFAQDKWSAELRINFSTSDKGDTELKTDFGAEFALGHRFMTHLGA